MQRLAIITYIEQLAAYGIEADKLYETYKMLADISAGLGVDMQRLILAYGQVRSVNILCGTELRQFTEAGIPMLEALSDRFSLLEGRAVSVGDVFERISKGKVMFSDVDAVLRSMTNKNKIMKCKELQFGDWCFDHHGFPMQITTVGDDYAYATFEGNEGDPWEFDDKDDQPCAIEITPDLLKANGWKIHTNSLPQSFKDYCYVKDESGNHLMWNSDVLSIWLDWEKDKDDEAFADIAIPIKYVHQLQQILRLAGMVDMANKFKV